MAIRRRNGQGFTIIEIMTSSAIFLIVLLLAGTLFVAANHLMSTSYNSYLISRDLSMGADTLRQDLKDTALGTLRVQNGTQPTLSFVTAYTVDDRLQLDSQGTPDWQGWIHYVLVPGKEKETGVLTKWSEYPKAPMPYPRIDEMRPAFPIPAEVKQQKVVLRDVVFPGQDLKDSGGHSLISDKDGFSVRFLRRESNGKYSLSDKNPAEYSASPEAIDGNTRLVEVTLRTFTRSSMGKVDTVGLRFRVCPRF